MSWQNLFASREKTPFVSIAKNHKPASNEENVEVFPIFLQLSFYSDVSEWARNVRVLLKIFTSGDMLHLWFATISMHVSDVTSFNYSFFERRVHLIADFRGYYFFRAHVRTLQPIFPHNLFCKAGRFQRRICKTSCVGIWVAKFNDVLKLPSDILLRMRGFADRQTMSFLCLQSLELGQICLYREDIIQHWASSEVQWAKNRRWHQRSWQKWHVRWCFEFEE